VLAAEEEEDLSEGDGKRKEKRKGKQGLLC